MGKKQRKKLSKAQLIRSRWLRGRLNYKLHSGQLKIERAVNSSQNQLFVGEIARQFGKSYWLVKKALEKAFTTPKGKIRYATAFHTDLLEFILPRFEEVLEDCPPDLKPIWNAQKSKFTLPHNGAEIRLIGLDRRPNGLRGNVLDLIIMDEAGFMSRLDYVYKSVIMFATTHRPNCRILVFSTPPETPAHEFIDYVQRAELEGGYLKLIIYDNPMLTAENIQRLCDAVGGPESTTWRREALCEHITDADLAIISDWKSEFEKEIPRDHYYGFYQKYEGMDLGVRHHTAAIFGYYDYLRAQLIIEHEFSIHGPKMTTAILQAHLKRRELQIWKGINDFNDLESKISLETLDIQSIDKRWEDDKPDGVFRVSDNNNQLLIQDLGHIHKLHFLPTDKGRLEEMVNTVKMLVRSGGLIVHPRCKQLIGCLKYGIWDKHRDKFAESKLYGHFDALAALIYLVRNLNRSHNPIPIDYQMDRDNQILFIGKGQTGAARTIRDAFGS